MEQTVSEAKAELRRRMRAELERISPEDRAAASAAARARLVEQRQWRQAGWVLLFAPLPEELDVWPLLALAVAAGKTVGVPRYDSARQVYAAGQILEELKDLKTGRFGIREAADHCPELSLNRLDLILVPGLAFDTRGRRLGRGKGFYDRMLKATRGLICGVAFDQQIVRAIPVDSHDEHVNCILTPSRWLEV